ncbi:hypothetical protein ACFFX0_11925 [Citricoccus parietis]|uniref:Uncharacterized protein n=1 Tax=Citricoccus parietis TaxID=592307 RepID=A0ABV5FYV6_9MICC
MARLSLDSGATLPERAGPAGQRTGRASAGWVSVRDCRAGRA